MEENGIVSQDQAASNQGNDIGTITNEEFGEMVNEFAGESDRATVILAAAKMDAMLGILISKVLLPVTSTHDDFLDNEGPLSTFSAKITLANRLGLLDSIFVKSLHIVRKIRNSFAHEVKGGKLNSGGHGDRIRELLLPFQGLNEYASFKTNCFGAKNGLDVDFRVIAAIIILRLDGAIHFAKPLNNHNNTELVPPNWKSG